MNLPEAVVSIVSIRFDFANDSAAHCIAPEWRPQSGGPQPQKPFTLGTLDLVLAHGQSLEHGGVGVGALLAVRVPIVFRNALLAQVTFDGR